MTSVWPVLAPRTRILVVEPGPPVSVISSPGTVRSASTSEPGLLVARVSLLTTLIALPVRLSGSGVLLGVTTSSEGCGGGASGLFGAGTGRLTGLAARRICRYWLGRPVWIDHHWRELVGTRLRACAAITACQSNDCRRAGSTIPETHSHPFRRPTVERVDTRQRPVSWLAVVSRSAFPDLRASPVAQLDRK